MSLSQQLREETREAHERMERTLDLLRPGFSTDDYRRLLEHWYGFLAVWEPASFATFGQSLEPYLNLRRKLPLLKADLESLGVEVTRLPRIDPTPLGWTEPSAALGTLYVIEGSTLGGQSITKRVQPMSLPTAYFASYGGDVGVRWRETKQLLDAPPFPAEPTMVIAGAHRTFDFLANWLK